MAMVTARLDRLRLQLQELLLPREQNAMGSHSHGQGQRREKMAAVAETDFRQQRWRLERVAFGDGGGASRLQR
jgi:hypothetical protein